MDSDLIPKTDVSVLAYAGAAHVRKPFSLFALIAGLAAPYAYAAVALVVISPFGFRHSGFEAFYSLHPAAIIAIAAFPLLVWQVGRRIHHRGFVRGVVIGAVALPLLALVALAISFSHGV
jgi:hypothetical protein